MRSAECGVRSAECGIEDRPSLIPHSEFRTPRLLRVGHSVQLQTIRSLREFMYHQVSNETWLRMNRTLPSARAT